MCLAKFISCLLSEEQKGIHVDTWRTFKRGLKETQYSFQRYHRWWDMGLWVWPRNQAESLTAHQPYTQNCKTSSLKLGEHPLCFLWHAQSCVLWICSTRTDCKPTLLTRRLTVPGRKRGENLESGIQGNGFFHHEYAPIHSALYVQDLLTNNKVTVIPHPPWFSTMWLLSFPRAQDGVRGKDI